MEPVVSDDEKQTILPHPRSQDHEKSIRIPSTRTSGRKMPKKRRNTRVDLFSTCCFSTVSQFVVQNTLE